MYKFSLVLDKSKIPVIKPPQNTVPPVKPMTMGGKIGSFVQGHYLLIGIIAIAIILVAIILIMFFKRNSKKKKQIQEVLNIIDNSKIGSINIGNTHHIGLRESQQDFFGISDISNKPLCDKKGVFAVIADGMGGLANGAEISAIVATSMLKYFNERTFHSAFQIELLNMVSYANEAVNSYLGRAGAGKSGSTVVSVIIKDRELFWTAVGDSRICLIRNGALIQINREHTYGPELDEKAAMGEISYEEAQNNSQRTALTSYIGMGKLYKIDRNIRPLQLNSGDRILLMSDGVFGTLSDDEILSVMNIPPYESAAMLEQMVLSKNKPNQDNFTAIILECL